MASRDHNVIHHLKLALEHLGRIKRRTDLRYRRENQWYVTKIDSPGILGIMKGLKVVAALKGIVNTTSLNTLSTEDKVAI